MSPRKDESAALGCIGVVVAPALMVYDAWAFHLLWRWFVVPLGATPIGMAQSAGLMCLYVVLAARPLGKPSDKTDAQWAGYVIGYGLFATTFALVVGWFLR